MFNSSRRNQPYGRNRAQDAAMARRRNSLMKGFNRRPSSFTVLFSVVSALIILGIIATIAIMVASNSQTGVAADCIVTGKDRVAVEGGGSDHRIYTSNCGVFTANDNLFDMKFNSADVYSQIKEGETYTFQTRGVRVPFLSIFPNIATATQVN